RDGVFYEGCFTIPQKDDNGEKVSVTVIENHAFHKSEKLYSADIELAGLGEIGDYAFANSKIQEIVIGAGINSIGDTNTDGETSVFSFCNDLESITIDKNNGYYADIDGVLFNKDITHLIRYPAGKNSNSYKVPDSVIEVWDNAFYGSKYLAFVTFSNRLTRLGSNPFDRSPSLVGIYFKDCYAPLSYGQDPFKTGNDSTVIYYTNGYYENSGAYLGWNIFETAYKISEYVPPFLQQGKPASYYTIAVMNQEGMPIDGVLVSLVDGHSNFDASYTVDGVRVFTDTYDAKYNVGFDIDFNTAYTLRVTDKNGVYFGYENAEFYLDEATRITYITLSSVPTVSGISVSYRCKKPEDISGDFWAGGQADTNLTFIQGAYYNVDINSEVAKVNTEIVDSFTVKVGCTSDAGSSITDYRLIQGDKELYNYSGAAISRGEEGYKPLEFTLNTTDVANEKDIVAEVTFVDEKGVKTVISEKLNIQVLKLELYALDLSWASNEIKLTIDDNIPVLGGAELSLSEFNKSKVNIAVGPDYFRILIGDFGNDDIKLENEFFESNYDRHWGQIFTKDKNRRLWESENVDKIGLTIGGYIEIKYKGINANGDPDFDLNSSITGNLKYTYADGITRTVWVIPIRLEYKLELGAEATFELSFDFDTKSLYAPNLQFEVNGSLSAYAGIGCKLASAGVYGNISSMMLWDIAPQFELNKWSLKGDLGAYVKYSGLFLKFEKKWSLFEELKWNNEWTIYNKAWISDTTDGWGNKVAKTYAAAVAEYYDQENYVVATSEDSGDYSGIEPQLLRLDDTHILIVYADDFSNSSGYDEYNYQKLVYQVYNTETKEYTKPEIIDDIRDTEGNGYADGMFTLYAGQNGVYLAFTQMTNRVTAENADDVESYVSALEVKTAVWDSEKSAFADIGFVSGNDCYDTALTMGEIDGCPAVIWIQNAENDITGVTKKNNMSILCSLYSGEEWNTYTVAQNLPSITDLALYDGTIAYITDSNNDLFTVTSEGENIEGYYDRKIITLDADGKVLSVSAEEDAYHDISVVGDSLVYYCANNLYDLQTGVALFDEAVANFPESYTVLTNEAGGLCGILYTDNMIYDSNSGENGSNIFGIFYDNGVWGRPVQLTDYGKGYYVSSFDAVSVDGELLLSALVTQMSENQNSGEDSELVTLNEFETTVISYPTGYSTEKPELVYEDIAPDSDLAVSIPIRNNGIDTLKVSEIELSLNGLGSISKILGIYDSDGNYLPDGLPSGTEGEVRIVYHTSSVSSAEPTINIGENSYKLELWYSDLAVSAKQVWLSGMPYLAASVYNLGLVPAKSGISLSINGDTFYTAQTNQLSYGEMQHLLVPINPDLLKGDAGMITVSLDIEGEYMLGNNETTVSFTSDEDVPLGEIVYDVNGDGSTDIRDLIRLKKIMAGVEKENRESDINFDGVLTSVDLGLLRKMFIVGVFDIKQIYNL
ncbi:MAG: leucine-rich repeat protein, partial [Clostridia bacterium]|nr:leucine-rich repeat protein [Clostridia bacterium]